MIKLHFDPKTDKTDLEVDLAWAFENAEDFPEFLTNAGFEAQSAILDIISRMYDTIKHVTKGQMTKEQAATVKKVLVGTACQDVDVALFDQFREEMGLE